MFTEKKEKIPIEDEITEKLLSVAGITRWSHREIYITERRNVNACC